MRPGRRRRGKAGEAAFAVRGARPHLYHSRVVEFARRLKPSARGELESTAPNECYLRAGELHVTVLDCDTAWLDMGTFNSLVQAAEFVRVIEGRQGLKIGCIEGPSGSPA